MTLRIALVGCGKVADQHVREIHKQRSAILVAVCDAEPLMAAQLAMRFGVAKHYSDFSRLLRETVPDIVHVCTPPGSHVPLAMESVKAGCHVLLEKPLAESSAQAATLLRYVHRNQRKLTVAHTYFFDPAMRSLRDLIRRGVLGEIVHVDSFFGYDLSGPYGQALREDPEHWVRHLPGGLIHNIIDHLLTKVIEFIPEEDPRIYVDAWATSSLGLPDELRLLVCGRNISVHTAFSSNCRPLVHRLSVFGSRQTIHVDFTGSTLVFEPSSMLPGAFGRLSCTFRQAREYFAQGMGNVVRFARSKYPPLPGLEFLISAFYDSIRLERPVPIPYDDILRVCRLTDSVFAQMYAEGARTHAYPGNGSKRLFGYSTD